MSTDGICTSIWVGVSTVIRSDKNQTMSTRQHIHNLINRIGAANRVGAQGNNNVLVEGVVVDCGLQQIYAHRHISTDRSVNLSIGQRILQVRTSTQRNGIANVGDSLNNVVVACLRGIRMLASHGHGALLLQRSIEQQIVLEIAKLWSG